MSFAWSQIRRHALLPLLGASSLLADSGEMLRKDRSEATLLLWSRAAIEMNLVRARELNSDRLKSYATALQLMHDEPRSADSIGEAQATLSALAAAMPGDDIGIASSYYEALITQLYLAEPDLETASRKLKDLSAAHPQHFFGQLALLKHIMIELFQKNGYANIGVIAYLEGASKKIDISHIRRSAHKVLGEAYRAGGHLPRKALEHFQRAREIGFSVPSTQADLAYAVAELAEELGNESLALEACIELRDLFPYDARLEQLSPRMKELLAAQP